MTNYPNLFQPGRIGSLELGNRIIMASMHTRLEQEPDARSRLEAFYRERALTRVGLIITGGYSPSPAGCIEAGSALFDSSEQVPFHRAIVRAVHDAGVPIGMQILHAGRYGRHSGLVAPSALPSHINSRIPHALSDAEIREVVDQYARTASLAAEAGYDAIELMGSEGYLINQFTCVRTNQRTDDWGGSLENRLRFPLEVVRAIRRAVGTTFPLIFRVSVLDLVSGGLSPDEVRQQVRLLKDENIDAFTTGVGWHEADVPTIAYQVPRAAWSQAARSLREYAGVPVIATNRMNTPEVAEAVIARGDADFVALARPFLADSGFVDKARRGEAHKINTCIACNQSCIDFIFRDKAVSCLVNPRAGRETTYPLGGRGRSKKIAVVGAGAAGLSCAVNAASLGHRVTLFEADKVIGGQLNYAKQIPGKEFSETLRYFEQAIQETNVDLRLESRPTASYLKQNFDAIVIATGVSPRVPTIEGIDHSKAVSYQDVLSGKVVVGYRVAVIGAGGVGHDVAIFLTAPVDRSTDPLGTFQREWGLAHGVGAPPREVHVFQRSEKPLGAGLGLSTRWIVRAELEHRNVKFQRGVDYRRIDDEGLHYTTPAGEESCFAADHVVICAGQVSHRDLFEELKELSAPVHLIGGASRSAELDAAKAIEEGLRTAYAF
jgi:2,4-dienoyl-CoA reductase (NADPH2)